MRCTVCCHTDSRVLESRSAEGGRSVRRRRECLHCRHRFTTYERIELVPITVLKRSGDRESFDTSKLLHGVARACEKTQISAQEQQRIVSDVAAEIQQRMLREIESTEIGQIVLQQLRPLSDVAYVRFASVYQQFQSIRDFVEALEQLREQPEAAGAERSTAECSTAERSTLQKSTSSPSRMSTAAN